jgi:RimJ/RimL family protein N-acetyltransferase
MDPTLLRGEQTRLAATNWEANAEAEVAAAWCSDPEFQHFFDAGPARQVTAQAFKTSQASAPGDAGARDSAYSYAIRALADDQLLGFVDLEIQPWCHRNGWVTIGIGLRECWGKGYGTDAMRVLLRFAFAELNLERVTLQVFAYNERAQRSYLKAGFQVEGRQRERLRRGSRRYDMIFMGILRDEWRSREWRAQMGAQTLTGTNWHAN